MIRAGQLLRVDALRRRGSGLVVALLLGCGGRTQALSNEVPADEGERQPDLDDPRGGSGERVPDAPRGRNLDFTRTPLGECVLGFPRALAQGRECVAEYDGLCYETRSGACSCACPRTGASQCVFGGLFRAAGEPLTVACF